MRMWQHHHQLSMQHIPFSSLRIHLSSETRTWTENSGNDPYKLVINTKKPFSPDFYLSTRSVFNFYTWKARILFGVDTPEGPPTPQTPLPCPHPDKKCTKLLLFEICIHLHHNHQDLKLECCRVEGQKLRYGFPCTHDLPGTHNWLAQPHIASNSLKFH